MPDQFGNPLPEDNFGGFQIPEISGASITAGSSFEAPNINGGNQPLNFNLGNANPGGGNTPTFLQKTFGRFNPETNKTEQGLFAPIAQGIGAIGNLGLGFKQLGQAEDAFNFQKDFANRNFEANQNILAFNISEKARGAAKLNNATDAEADAAGKAAIEKSGVKNV